VGAPGCTASEGHGIGSERYRDESCIGLHTRATKPNSVKFTCQCKRGAVDLRRLLGFSGGVLSSPPATVMWCVWSLIVSDPAALTAVLCTSIWNFRFSNLLCWFPGRRSRGHNSPTPFVVSFSRVFGPQISMQILTKVLSKPADGCGIMPL
jgi:hypothetical protein